jgi:hypothetical protein
VEEYTPFWRRIYVDRESLNILTHGIRKKHIEVWPDTFHWCYEFDGKNYNRDENGKLKDCTFVTKGKIEINGDVDIKAAIITSDDSITFTC